MKAGSVKLSEIMKDPHLRLTPSLYLKEKTETKRPIHKVLSAGDKEKPDCVDVCEKITAKLLEAGFSRKGLGLDGDELDHTKILEALEDAAVVKKEVNFTKTERGERILWCVLEDDAQEMAMRILGRRLSEDELYRVKKSLEYGFEDWTIVLKTAIEDLEE